MTSSVPFRIKRTSRFYREHVLPGLPEATIFPIVQEGSPLARRSFPIPSGALAPLPTYTPWRDRPFLQMKTASEIVGVSVASLYKFSDTGRLKLREFGGRTLVDTESLIALIETAVDWTPKARGVEARAKRKEVAAAGLRS